MSYLDEIQLPNNAKPTTEGDYFSRVTLPSNPQQAEKINKLQLEAQQSQDEAAKQNSSSAIFWRTVTGLPKATKDVAVSIARAVPRSIMSIAMTLAPEKVRENIGQINPQEDLGKVGTFAFGNEPIRAMQDRTIETSNTLQSYGLGQRTADGLSTLGIVGGSLLDVYPGGAGDKKGIKAAAEGAGKTVDELVEFLAKTDSKRVIGGVLRTLGFAKEEIPSATKLLVDAGTPQEVRSILGIPELEIKNVPRELQGIGKIAQESKTPEEFLNTIKKSTPEDLGLTDESMAKVLDQAKKDGTTPDQMFADFYEHVKKENPPASGEALVQEKIMPRQEGLPNNLKTDETIPPRMNSQSNPLKESVPPTSTLVNLERLNLSPETRKVMTDLIESIRPALEQVKGAPLTHEEVIQAAKDSQVLQKAISREQTLKTEAEILKTRQSLTALAEEKGVSKTLIDQIRIVKSYAADTARKLNAFGISADPELATSKIGILKKLDDLGIESEKIIKVAEGVDFNNAKQVIEFYRKFVPATFGEKLNEFRYINLLSSPKTHIVNAFSNMIQVGLSAATRFSSGLVDIVASKMTGREREVYLKEVPAYARGVIDSFGEASQAFSKAMKGETLLLRPDLKNIPTGSRLLKPFQTIPRLLEASDVYFRTLIKRGEEKALIARAVEKGEELTTAKLAEISDQADKTAAYGVFRKALDPTNKSGQGYALSAIDRVTSQVINPMRRFEVAGVKPVAWFVPFVETPMNILKQGIEYSPMGLTTLPGATNKAEQVAKTLIGSTVFVAAGAMALDGRATWAVPTDQDEKNAFYNSGRQPYSVKIGDKWISYSKLGGLAYPIAMAAAANWYLRENPKAASESNFQRFGDLLGGIGRFFADQSYLQGISDLASILPGQSNQDQKLSTIVSNFGTQLVPLSSLDRWITQIIDPTFRKPTTKSDLVQIVQNIEKGIPGLSTNVPEIPGAQPRQNTLLNAFAPLQVTNVDQRYETQLQRIRRDQERKAERKARLDNRK